MKQLKFVAHYEDETVQGNPLGNRDSLWTSLPDKPIKALEYMLPHANDSIKLSGYEEYLHMVEVCMPMGGNAVIEHVYLMGRIGSKVVSYRITILQKTQKDRYKVGDITVRVLDSGKEYRGGATAGWLIGDPTVK
jgi:hypothetical protein